MNIKDLFDQKKRDTLLQDALKKARAKKGGSFPFAFAMMGSNKALLVLDWRCEFNSEKLIKQMRKERPLKMIVGTAAVNGKTLELKVEEKKGTIKPRDVREYLAKNKLMVSKAAIEDPKSPKQAGDEANQQPARGQ